MDIHPLAVLAADVVVIVGAVALIARPLRGSFRRVMSIADDVADIKKQVLPNGGSSIRDAVDRMEERQLEIAGQVDRANARLDTHLQAHLR